MNIIIPKEASSELRVAMLPQNVEKLVKKGAKINHRIETRHYTWYFR